MMLIVQVGKAVHLTSLWSLSLFSLIHHLFIVQVGTSAHLAPRPKPPGVQFVQWHLAWLCGGPQLWHWQSHLGKGLNNQLISSFVTFTFSALTLAKPSWQRFYQFALLSLSLSHLWHGKAILAKVDIIFSWCHFHFLTTLLLHCPSFDIGKAIVAKVWLICSVTFTFSALTSAKQSWQKFILFSHVTFSQDFDISKAILAKVIIMMSLSLSQLSFGISKTILAKV